MKRTLITVLTWNRLSITKRTIKSFIKYNGNEHDFLFVDNASKDGTTKWIEDQGYDVIKNETNMGVFGATRRVWRRACKLGYDFVLNLQNDFPCIRTIPWDDIYLLLDTYANIGFVQLNNKKFLVIKKGRKYRLKIKHRIKNACTKKRLAYKTVRIGGTKFLVGNHHISFNPNIIRTSIVNHLVRKIEKPRERQIMERFESLKMKSSRTRKRCFETIIRKRDGKWTR